MSFEAFQVDTNHPIASDSPDHLCPWGTARDDSQNARFNEKVFQLYQTTGVGFKALDLGCSGGGLVKSLSDRGCVAIGLEGSDFSKKMCRAHWPLLADRLLFTADITKPYTVKGVNREKCTPLTFNLITMWEVLEHLKEEDLPQTLDTIKKHLTADGILVVSISPNDEVIEGVTLHQTVKPLSWWLDTFKNQGFTRLPAIEIFFNNQYVRGPKQNAEGSYNCIFSLHPDKAPLPPKLTLKGRLFDFWLTSRAKHICQRLINN